MPSPSHRLDPTAPQSPSQVPNSLQTSSLLLRLPLELRRQIYCAVLGDHLIHLHPLHSKERDKPTHRFRHSVCHAPGSETTSMANFQSDSSGNTVSRWDRHRGCWPDMRDPPLVARSEELCLSLGLLGACRQTYAEASDVLWSTSTFSFVQHETFVSFIDDRTPAQLSRMGGLHLVIKLVCADDVRWLEALSAERVQKLQGLRRLHVFIILIDVLWLAECARLLLRCHLEWFRIAPLNRVTVVLRRPGLLQRDSSDVDWCNGMRDRLLKSAES